MGREGTASGGNELGEFLRARRAALDPAGSGFPDDGRLRRVPGLRREELAQLAHVSIDYVVRLEQGRTRRVSRPVLEALMDALQPASDERAYLFALADVTQPPTARRGNLRSRPQPPGVLPETPLSRVRFRTAQDAHREDSEAGTTCALLVGKGPPDVTAPVATASQAANDEVENGEA
ncbi:helix-turn-helix domain-containing protein [Streptomyces sp. NPDC002520]